MNTLSISRSGVIGQRAIAILLFHFQMMLIDVQTNTVAVDAEQKKKRTFKKFTYRGIDLDKLLDMSPKDLMELVDVSVIVYCDLQARARRRFRRGLKRKPLALLKRLRKAVSCYVIVLICRRLNALRMSVLNPLRLTSVTCWSFLR